MAFIEQASGTAPAERPACFLCAYPAQGEEHDPDNLLLYRGQQAYVLMNRYPYNPGHLMIAPYAHGGDLPALPTATADELFALTQRAVAALGAEYQPDGYNVGLNLGRSAGAGVPDHLHVHVVPRWNGDTSFFTVVGETRTLPESLAQTYGRLRPRFDNPAA